MQFQLSIQTLTTTVAGTLRKAKKNDKGFYEGVPLTVLGAVSRNNYYYDPASLVNAMGNPNTRFYKALLGGGLNGEWGHPDTSALTEEQAIKRTLNVLEQQTSHYFNRIWIDTLSDGTQLVRGDVKPFGVYGKYLEEAFNDEHHDAAFSLRSITSDPVKRGDGSYFRKVLALITYDGLSLPGYELASKRGMLGQEGFMQIAEEGFHRPIQVEHAMLDSMYETIGYESWQCQEVLEYSSV